MSHGVAGRQPPPPEQQPGHARKRVLMVAFHFPPLAGSSGIQRTLRFVQQLPALGWQPIVLGASPRAFERTSSDLDGEVPPGTPVRRAFALDTARHLSIGGRYPGALARPDRWMTWQFDAVRVGMQLIREYRPQALWTTYPIATAHRIGAALQARSGLPWIADFRDPMAQPGYPADPETWRSFSAIEAAVFGQARLCTFTTRSALATYRERYRDSPARSALLENGFDEPTFSTAEAALPDRAPLNPGAFTLLHSGVVYPSERDPSALVAALGVIKRQMPGLAANLRVRFRASGHDDLLAALATQHGVADMIQLCPPVGYAAALAEMLRADGLLVLQAANCNEQVPAKVYEYLRARRPIVCLSDVAGDTWGVLHEAGVQRLAPLDDAAAIAAFIGAVAAGDTRGLSPRPDAVAGASRQARSATLARWLDEVAVTSAATPAAASR